jgi:ATP-dependent DNA helicase RecG
MNKPARELPLETPLFEALGARAPLLRPLEKLGLKTVGDLLFYFPVRYEDFTRMAEIADLEPGQQVTIQAAIEDIRSFRTRRGLTVVEAVIADESASMKAVWFNQPYVTNTLHPGRIANFSGKVSFSDEKGLYLASPHYEIVKDSGGRSEEEGSEVQLVPIYPETRGITSRGIRYVVQRLVRLNPILPEWIPLPTRKDVGIPEVKAAIRSMHFPGNIEEAMLAQKRFSFEKLFLLQLWNVEQRLRLGEKKAPAIGADIERLKAILAKLPFALTASQKQSLWDIIQDIGKPTPMNRLLQGDVGSGKTIVAALSAIIAAEAGYQTAFMAPTEILVGQHFQTMQKLVARIGSEIKEVTVGLVTASGATILYPDGLASDVSKKEFHAKVAEGAITVIFGTHALIQKTVNFKNLGLVVIDEQHRFGVKQRQALLRNSELRISNSEFKKDEQESAIRNPQSTNSLLPHFLSMSATPIPRTLTLTVFGDLDLSLITELPAGRKPIETKIVTPLERSAAYAFIRKEIKAGRQAFVICPRIEEEKPIADGELRINGNPQSAIRNPQPKNSVELKSVKTEYEKLSQKIFPDLKVAMLHGQMKADEKEQIMRDFVDGKIDILVATSVIEVGVDVPNATIMMIEGTERFGLAQLYQFRGRVGRGGHQSYCFLMSESSGAATKARLQAILNAKNGFELAEYDLKLRGPGEFFGQAQSGFSDTAMAAVQNPELVKISREAAANLLGADPTLNHYPPLRQKLAAFEKTIHRE